MPLQENLVYDCVMEEHLTVEEAATRLKFSAPTVRRLLRDGEIHGVKFGPRQWRVTESAIQDYVTRHSQKPAAAKD
jgi:excisionase family DNA binding protein